MWAISWTARSNASSVLADVDCTPLTFRTYWRAAASISSLVAAGSSPRRVVMFLHMETTVEGIRTGDAPPSKLHRAFGGPPVPAAP